MKTKLLFLFPVAVLIIFLSLYGSAENKIIKPETTKYEVALRLIGHRLLLSGGDTKSLVLPIKTLSEDKFQISFEKPVSFDHDSLFRIVTKTASAYSLPGNYTVNVFNCYDNEVVYSFLMSHIDSNTVVPCLGRALPKGCYYLVMDFSRSGFSGSNNFPIILTGVLLSALLGFLIYYFNRKQSKNVAQPVVTSIDPGSIRIGEFLFYPNQRSIEIHGKKIELTDKESHLLQILASDQNQVVSRERLQKEVWENEGVIVTRSLDVFISKLRKKLEKDPRVRITNIHSKGYRLEINK